MPSSAPLSLECTEPPFSSLPGLEPSPSSCSEGSHPPVAGLQSASLVTQGLHSHPHLCPHLPPFILCILFTAFSKTRRFTFISCQFSGQPHEGRTCLVYGYNPHASPHASPHAQQAPCKESATCMHLTWSGVKSRIISPKGGEKNRNMRT